MTDRNLQPVKSSRDQVPRCHLGRETEHPCWRTATTKLFLEDKELNLCDEHAREIQLANEADHVHYNLTTLLEAFAAHTADGTFERSPGLEERALSRLEQQRRKYAQVYTAHRSAMVVADWEPPDEGEPELAYEQREKLARLMLRVDALGNTRTLLEDLPEEALGLHERWVMLDAVCDAVDAANEEVDRYRREIGLEQDREEEAPLQTRNWS